MEIFSDLLSLCGGNTRWITPINGGFVSRQAVIISVVLAWNKQIAIATRIHDSKSISMRLLVFIIGMWPVVQIRIWIKSGER